MTLKTNIAADICDLIRDAFEGLSPDERRIVANRVVEFLGSWTTKPKSSAQAQPLPMTDQEAEKFGSQRFVFGKYAGQRYCDCLSYLECLADTNRSEWRDLHRYLNNASVKMKANADAQSIVRPCDKEHGD